MVTGGREVTTMLSIDAQGGWKLENGATLYDVTHLPCRSARYTSLGASAVTGRPLGKRKVNRRR